MPRAALCLIALAAALTSGSAAPAATSGVNGDLLVASGQRHQMTLFAIQPGSGDRLLLNYGTDQGAAYSPDGTKIAFMNNYDGDFEICLMNADGTGVKQLTKNSSIDGYPTWSPDGRRIAFASNRDGDDDIWVMNADGSNQTNITSNDPADNEDPHWSPDGRFIGSTTDQYGYWHVLVMTPDGAFETPLDWRRESAWFDSWSPDGKSFLVHSNLEGDYDIYRYDIPDADPVQWMLLEGKLVSDDSAAEERAVWSPDGKQIAFSSNRDGDFEIYVMNAAGGPQRQITHNNVDDMVEDWQSLSDVRAPTLTAVPSRGRPGKRIALRFKVSDDSGRASVAITVFVGKRPYGYLHTPLKARSAGHTYTVSWRSPSVRGLLRFCGDAYDPSGNESGRSCAPIVTRG
jgi:Tol biopolymer transport system component